MTTFLALYRGDKVDSAQLVAVSTDTDLVILVAKRIIDHGSKIQHTDPVLNTLHLRRLAALSSIIQINAPAECLNNNSREDETL